MKDAFYFSHDSNARNDIKIQALRSVYGIKGYGMYWVLIEMMRETENYSLPFNQKFAYLGLSKEMECSVEESKQFINDCINEFELFQSDELYFWSESLLRRMEKYKQKIEVKSINGKKGGRPKLNNIVGENIKEELKREIEPITVEITHKDNVIQHINKKQITYSDDVIYLADLLFDKMKKNNQNVKKASDISKWHDDIDKLMRIDKYNFSQIVDVIEWCQQDSFWKSNILSPKKLREKFSQLILLSANKKIINKENDFDKFMRLATERDERIELERNNKFANGFES